MMTQTHALFAGALLARANRPALNIAVLTGSLVPDAALYILFAIARFQGISDRVIFRDLYWSPTWQTAMSPGNSFILYALLAMLAYAMMRPGGRLVWTGALIMGFAVAALLHVATDFPLHVDDAHSHFWPISEWKFVSMISYWDQRHHANWVQPLEFLLAIICLVALLIRFRSFWVRAVLTLLLVAYIAVPAYF